MEVIVDRVENGVLILELEDGTLASLPQKLIPTAKEGDVITFAVDKDKTQNRKKKMAERVNRLWKD